LIRKIASFDGFDGHFVSTHYLLYKRRETKCPIKRRVSSIIPILTSIVQTVAKPKKEASITRTKPVTMGWRRIARVAARQGERSGEAQRSFGQSIANRAAAGERRTRRSIWNTVGNIVKTTKRR
jgi:hypothetical protein